MVAEASADSENDALTPAEVAGIFRVTERTVGIWAEQGKLPSFRTPGGQWRFHRAEVEAFIAGQRGGVVA